MSDKLTYLVGSNFYNLNTPTSDKDYIQFMFPSKEDLFKGNFTSKQVKDENGNDVIIKDIRLLLKGLKKGSLQIFEALYSEPLEYINAFNDFYMTNGYLKEYRDDLVRNQRGELLKAIQGELTNRYKKFKSENTVKEYIHCYKLIWLFWKLYHGYNPFKLIAGQDYIATDYFDHYKNLRLNYNSFKDMSDSISRKEGLESCYNDIKSASIEINNDKSSLEFIEDIFFSEVFTLVC